MGVTCVSNMLEYNCLVAKTVAYLQEIYIFEEI